MKEATGELNMNVIVAISVGILMAFFFSFLWPATKDNFNRTANCKNANCNCSNYKENDYMCDCTYTAKDGKVTEMQCPYGG